MCKTHLQQHRHEKLFCGRAQQLPFLALSTQEEFNVIKNNSHYCATCKRLWRKRPNVLLLALEDNIQKVDLTQLFKEQDEILTDYPFKP
jgi:hypothetical protein